MSKGDILIRLVNEAALDNDGGGAMVAGYWPATDVDDTQSSSQPTIHVVGLADRESNTSLVPTDRMRIGSITKSVTVTVLLQLFDEGVINMDDPISMYFPETQNGNATLTQLADMTSGICNYLDDPELAIEFVFNLTRVWTIDDLINICPPYAAPGELWRYSNTNTILLGGVIEQVTGTILAEEMKTRIFDPLNMTNTIYPSTYEFPSSSTGTGYANGYIGLIDDDTGMIEILNATFANPTASQGAGALTSSLEDMRIWVTALVNGTLISSESKSLQQTLVPTLNEINSPTYDAYGLAIGSLGGWLGHTGDYVGYQALAMANPEDLSVVVILTNYKSLYSREHIPEEIFLEWIAETTNSKNNETEAPTVVPTIMMSGGNVRLSTATNGSSLLLTIVMIFYWLVLY